MTVNALVLTGGLLHTSDAKTGHGLIRESNRFNIVGIVDHVHAGKDAGEVLDGQNRGLPIFATVEESLAGRPEYCIVGVATTGGVFPDRMLADIKVAIESGLSIINGLHDYLSDRADMVELAQKRQVKLVDIRRPKSRAELHFWTGRIRQLKTPVIALLGTDCSLGKRTTTRFILQACADHGIHAEMIYTGQTGWLQGGQYGFVLDSTLNDFVGGEMEHAVMTCVEETSPDVVLIEGQAALRNPSGPCGSEMLISGNAKYVVLVHAPRRKYFEHDPAWGEIPDLGTEIELIRMYGSEVIAIAINTEDCTQEEARNFKLQYQERFKMPVMLPLEEGCEALIPLIKKLI